MESRTLFIVFYHGMIYGIFSTLEQALDYQSELKNSHNSNLFFNCEIRAIEMNKKRYIKSKNGSQTLIDVDWFLRKIY